jgi:pimeloyl-ACP methyl ester carboxylesterase
MSDYLDLFFSAQDGLALYARDYPAAQPSDLTPVICLPGLTRSSTDFADLAERLSAKRRVLCPDFRGRGLSAYAPSPESYTPLIELADTFALLAIAGVHRAVFIGTSRGGIVSMLACVAHPAAVAGVVLNDIGPEIELAGLKRIAGYAGAQAPVANWAEAEAQVRETNISQFPHLGAQDWANMARRLYKEVDGHISLAYDPQIGTATRSGLEGLGDKPPPDLWVPFQALANIPCHVIQGELSDILTDPIVAKMHTAKPDLVVTKVPGRGHAPLLDEPEALESINALLAKVDHLPMA